jgi:hypothetical protein
MANKTYVIVKCNVDIFDSKLKSGVTDTITDYVEKAINEKSNGKLSTKEKNEKGFILTMTVKVTADDKQKPRKIDVKVDVVVMAVGSTAKAFTGHSGAGKEGVGPNVESEVEDLTTEDILKDFMPKVIATISRL